MDKISHEHIKTDWLYLKCISRQIGFISSALSDKELAVVPHLAGD